MLRLWQKNSRRKTSFARKTEGGKYAEACFGSFPGLPDCAAFAQSGNLIREARAFPLQTLVLAFSARSRHIGQVCLRPDVVGTYEFIIDEWLKGSLFIIANNVFLTSEQD